MAKKGMNPNDDDFGDFDEDDAPAQKVAGAGIPAKKLQDAAAKWAELRSEMRDIAGDMGTVAKNLENDGGNKRAFKFTVALKAMEPEAAQDLWRSIHSYVKQLGVDKSHGLENSQLFSVDQAPAPLPKGEKAPKAPSAKFGAAAH